MSRSLVLVAGLSLSGAVLLTGGSCAKFRGAKARSTAAPTPVVSPATDTDFLTQYAQTRRFGAGAPTSIKPTPNGDAVLFLRSGPRDNVRNLYEFDVATGEERVLLTAEQILQGQEEELSEEEKARRERMRLSARGVATYSLSKDGSQILVPLSGNLYVVDRATKHVTELTSDAGFPIDPQFSPDGTRIGVARDGDLYVMEIASGDETRLTVVESATITNGVAEFVAQEEMSRYSGFWWSPDSQTIAYQQTDTAGMEVMHLVDPTKAYEEPNTWPYPRPGKKNASVRLGLMPATGGETTWVEWDSERYPYLATVKWSQSAPLTLVVQNRLQTEEAILAVDESTGETTVLHVESDDRWVDLDQDMPHWTEDGSAFLWSTDRNGGRQIEMRDSDGELIRTLTEPSLHYTGFVHLDEDEGFVYFTGHGDNPTERHLYAAPLDIAQERPQQLSEERGQHSAVFSEDGTVRVGTSTLMTGERRYVVEKNRQRVGTIASLAETPVMPINLELTTVSDGERSFHAAIIRPNGFEPGRKYPVINHVYGGPTSQMASASPMRYALDQWFADHGYIVVAIDGRGTPGRGSLWLKQIKGDFITTQLRDQATATLALCDKYPEMDRERIGMYGWSFGGYFSAMAVMQRPDVFKAGVAGAPVCEWEDYDTHYTERYLGLPQDDPEAYRVSNVLTYTSDLERPLLIVHGTVDDNVYFTHAIEMSDALFRAGQHHEFLPLSGFTHMVPDPLVTQRLYSRLLGFFDRSL
jgi:dipeptidyl-peptidase-4